MIDSFGRKIDYLRVSVTDRCNLRCYYCMPGGLPDFYPSVLSDEEILKALHVAAELGIQKIRMTGGEPLVRPGFAELCSRIGKIPGIETLAVTTNGLLLKDMAQPLKRAGVSRVNISLDTLDRDRYEKITGSPRLGDVLSGVDAALQAGFRQVKINAVILGGVNDNEVHSLAALSCELPVDVRFIELMPIYMDELDRESFRSGSKVLASLPDVVCEGFEGTAEIYRIPGAKGRIGLIRPLSASFCGSCNRLRLTADGRIKPCLHSDLSFSVKGLDEEGIRRQFEAAVMAKPACHGPLSADETSQAGECMYKVGG